MGSYRDQLERKERRAWIQEEAQRLRDAEDLRQYEEQYLETFKREQARVPKAGQIAPLSFKEWRSYMDHDEPDTALRGLKASSKSLWKRTMEVSRDAIANRPLEDWELETLGYDLSQRIHDDTDIDI